MINRCFPAEIGHYYFSGWLHSCTRSPRHGYTFKAICVLAMKSTHAKVCVLHTKSIPDNLTPHYSRSYKPFTEREQSALEEKKREWEENTQTHTHTSPPLAFGHWWPRLFCEPFSIASLKHLLTFFLFPVRTNHCAKALKSSRVLPLSGFKHDVICIHAFEISSSTGAPDFLGSREFWQSLYSLIQYIQKCAGVIHKS